MLTCSKPKQHAILISALQICALYLQGVFSIQIKVKLKLQAGPPALRAEYKHGLDLSSSAMAPTYWNIIQRFLSVLVVTPRGVGEMESDFDIGCETKWDNGLNFQLVSEGHMDSRFWRVETASGRSPSSCNSRPMMFGCRGSAMYLVPLHYFARANSTACIATKPTKAFDH